MKYDVIIAGGGTAGCSAAYNLAARNFKVLLIEKNSFLGGTMTSGLVTPMMKISGNAINIDFYNLILDNLKSVGGQFTYSDNNKGWFNPELMKIELDNLLSKFGVDILFNSEISDIKISGSDIVAVKIDNKMLSAYIETRYTIDATGDCGICEKLNCEFLEDNLLQPVSLRFIMGGIDLKVFSKWLSDTDSDRDVTSVTAEEGEIHLSTAYTWDTEKKWALKPLFDDAVANGVLEKEDTNYFQLFSIPGMSNSIAFNAPRIYFDCDINPEDVKAVSNALIKGRQAILRISEFCKTYFPGFKNAYISNIANSLGVRVSKRIRGKYIYKLDDIISGKKCSNPAVISDYPIDVHSLKNNKSVLQKSNTDYYLPIESLISNDYNNLFVIGRCLSADFMAQGALRIIPNCFSMGEAVAKYISKLEN